MATPSKLELAMRTRSLRAIQTELEFLDSVGLITPAQMNSILPPLKAIADAHASEAERALPSAPQQLAQPEPVHPVAVQAQPPPNPYVPSYSPPASQMSNMSVNEKAAQHNQYASQTPQPPPAYAQAPAPAAEVARALYAYNPTDAGDLGFKPNDRIQITQKLNGDWWRGRNEQSGQEGIFPSSYVVIENEKAAPIQSPPPTNYGNLPLQVSQGGPPAPTSPEDPKSNKLEQGGKKFGKKLGNAAIFGAGATIGGNIVNSIF